MLLHGHVIAVVPAEVLRGAVVACLAAGAGLLAAVLTLPSD
ncbi:MAG TPA: hypothetical protein VFL66_02035 [Gaiellaceae bacterium]|nr:hypothetical protein [Gaiellaceae bacterium]